MLGDAWDKVNRRAAASFSQMNFNCVWCIKPIFPMATITASRPEHSVPTRMVWTELARLTFNHAVAKGVCRGRLFPRVVTLATFAACSFFLLSDLVILTFTWAAFGVTFLLFTFCEWAALGAVPCPCGGTGCFLFPPRCRRRTCIRSASSSQSRSIAWEAFKTSGCC